MQKQRVAYVEAVIDTEKSRIIIEPMEKYGPRPRNDSIGVGMSKNLKAVMGNKDIPHAMDIFMTFTQKECQLFFRLARDRDLKTNLVLFDTSSYGSRDVYRILKALSDKNVLLKVSKGKYMINPFTIFSGYADFVEIANKWYQLGGK